MSEYKDVVNALATKLQKDRNDVKWEDGSENLNYIMDVRLNQDIIDTLTTNTAMSYDEAISIASKITNKYIDGLIGLAKIG